MLLPLSRRVAARGARMGVLRLIGGVAASLLVLAAVALQGACTANKSPLASASPLEKQFVAAAITWDLNQDGDVTCAEWKQYAAQLFREADRNRDGYLNREEYSVMARTDRLFETAGFAYFDGDGDGRITLAEIADRPNPAFDLLDRNKDCVIALDERAGQRGSGSAGGDGKYPGGGGGGRPRRPPP